MNKRSALAAVSCAIALSVLPVNATTCVQGKKFKVRQVCGLVTDEYGAAVPGAKIKVISMAHRYDPKEATSDSDGRFMLPTIAEGEYAIQIDSKYFWNTSQVFTVVHSRAPEKCDEPIHVIMKPAGRCSYVENAWPELKRK